MTKLPTCSSDLLLEVAGQERVTEQALAHSKRAAGLGLEPGRLHRGAAAPVNELHADPHVLCFIHMHLCIIETILQESKTLLLYRRLTALILQSCFLVGAPAVSDGFVLQPQDGLFQLLKLHLYMYSV